MGCSYHSIALCITTAPYNNLSLAANISKQLSSLLLGNWTHKFDNLTTQLQHQITTINRTKVDIPTLAFTVHTLSKQVLGWVQQNWLQTAILRVILLAASIWIYNMIRQTFQLQRRQATVIKQAFTALTTENTPHIWLNMLDW